MQLSKNWHTRPEGGVYAGLWFDQPWQWTHNVGGGDYFRLFDPSGRRVPHTGMRTAYERQGPCLTEVTFAGRLSEGLQHAVTVSLARTDDLVRGLYRLRLEVTKSAEFSRFVLFQIGADTYSYIAERTLALGNETGLLREWQPHWGGNTNRTAPMECTGRVPWLSLHEAVSRADQEARNKGEKGAPGSWANRGIVIRAWQARRQVERVAALVAATMILGSFMSNTAAANLLLPVGLAAAAAAGSEGGLHPVQVALSIALAASLAMPLPISTPSNAIAFAKGEFATRDTARMALIIALPAALLIITGGGWVLRFWGLLQ